MLGGAVAAACSTFSGGATNEAPDAGPPSDSGVATSDGGPTEIGDATTADPDAGSAPSIEAGATRPLCPAAAGPGAFSGVVELSPPPASGSEYPFQLATDSKLIFWAAQFSLPDDASFHVAYDGHGASRIYRRAKSTPSLPPDRLVDNQSIVTSIAIDGDFVYWVTWDTTANTLHRVRRDCTAPCTAEDVSNGRLANGSPVVELLATSPGFLVYVTLNAAFYRVKLDGITLPFALLPAQSTAGVAAKTDTLFVGLPAQGAPVDVFDNVSTTNTGTPSGMIAGITKQSAAHLATDCNNLFAYGTNGGIYDTALTDKNLKFWTDGGIPEVFDLALDLQNVYLAQANSGGVLAFNRTTQAPTPLYHGNVWRLAVDDDGVYWGEHGSSTSGAGGGAIYWYKY